MNTNSAPANHPMNPDYGQGIFRRRIRLQQQPGKVIAELEDCNHGFRSVVHHDGHKVTNIEPESLRVPLTSCSQATKLVVDLIGAQLSANNGELAQIANPKSNCTHLYDLTVLAIHHATRAEAERLYDIVIPDENNGQTCAQLFCNGELLLSWSVANWQLQNPELHGLSLAMGFGKWASNKYQGEQREAAFMLQKGYMVSNARRYDMSKIQGTPATVVEGMSGACYSYMPEIVITAHRTYNSTRDFTDCEEKLLRFE